MAEERPEGHIGVSAVAGQVIALGREVESLRRLTDTQRGRLRTVEDQVGEVNERLRALATTLSGFGEQLAELAADDGGPGRHTSWFEADNSAAAEYRLAELMNWLDLVYLRFPDAALPSCWLWHPTVVEELLWLRRSWLEAFTGRTAAVFRGADWHDRQRPGVIARIGALNGGMCSLDQHVRGAEQDRPSRTVPIAGGRSPIAAWWVTDRDGEPPYPTAEQLVEASGRHS
jgi:hypothetical protein